MKFEKLTDFNQQCSFKIIYDVIVCVESRKFTKFWYTNPNAGIYFLSGGC